MKIVEFRKLYKFTKKLKLLYFEDDEESIKLNLVFFEKYFDEIIVVKDKKEALEKLNNYEIDVLISEISFESFDGIALFKEIKKLNKNIVKIIFSKQNNCNIFIETINLGINGYLTKPFNDKQFRRIITKNVCEYITNKKEKSDIKLLTQYQEIVNKNTIISKTNPSGIITYVNSNFCKISG